MKYFHAAEHWVAGKMRAMHAGSGVGKQAGLLVGSCLVWYFVPG
jgi:hypothetical protein